MSETPGRSTSPVASPVTLEDRVAAAVLAVDGVADLHGGTFGEAATYLPGRRLRGVRSTADGMDVHVTLRYGLDVREVAVRVQRAVAAVAPGPVSVTVEDVLPADTPSVGSAS